MPKYIAQNLISSSLPISVKVYASLWDYRKTVFKEASESGVPAMRHMMLEFPNDPKVYETKRYQYLLGADLLVAPVVEPGKDTRRLYLPGDNVEWTHFWSGKKIYFRRGNYHSF